YSLRSSAIVSPPTFFVGALTVSLLNFSAKAAPRAAAAAATVRPTWPSRRADRIIALTVDGAGARELTAGGGRFNRRAPGQRDGGGVQTNGDQGEWVGKQKRSAQEIFWGADPPRRSILTADPFGTGMTSAAGRLGYELAPTTAAASRSPLPSLPASGSERDLVWVERENLISAHRASSLWITHGFSRHNKSIGPH